MENNFEPTDKKSLPLPLIATIIVILLVASVGGYFLVQSQDKETTTPSPQPQAMNNAQEPVTINENSVMGVDVTAESNTADITFEISGKNFEYSETELTINKGDTVKIIFTSTDGFHDWRLDEFGAASARVNTGGTTEVIFTADKTGKFEFYCSVGNHRAMGMVGTLTVK